MTSSSSTCFIELFSPKANESWSDRRTGLYGQQHKSRNLLHKHFHIYAEGPKLLYSIVEVSLLPIMCT